MSSTDLKRGDLKPRSEKKQHGDEVKVEKNRKNRPINIKMV